MQTQCPHCWTLFNVTAVQLRAAYGTVRCSNCMETFDALEQLLDEPSDQPQVTVETHGDRTVMRVPGERSTWTLAEEAAETRVADAGHQPDLESIETALSFDSERPASAVPREEPADFDKHIETLREIVPALPSELELEDALRDLSPILEELSEADEAEFVNEEDEAADADGPATEFEEGGVPEVLQEDVQRLAALAGKKRQRYLFGVVSFLLLSALGFQYAWFMPQDMARRYPQARPLLKSLCMHTGCALPERRDPSRVQVVSRDVRVHPEYEGALLVTAALVNAAGFVQPYPRMQFTLFNVNGQTIATRTFLPREYLEAGIDVAAGMAPKSPTQIALDVLAPDEAAVSFEFRFL